MTTPKEAGLMAGMDDDTAEMYAEVIREREARFRHRTHLVEYWAKLKQDTTDTDTYEEEHA